MEWQNCIAHSLLCQNQFKFNGCFVRRIVQLPNGEKSLVQQNKNIRIASELMAEENFEFQRNMFRKEEIVVESNCEIRMNSLKQSGTYKCAATIPNHLDQRYRAFSSEFAINVVGIEPVKVISSVLPLNKNGEINLEVCANPRPEVFWHTVDGIITPNRASDRFAVTNLTPRTNLKVKTEPMTTIPYCYQTSLLIHKVQGNDEFHMSIRGELDIVHEKITVKVKVCI
uniref:Ig-like domain-containing protein n=1 Tax=Caenorhabditis tropicalis TaxID=1561998 RepID=A0A1I7THQ4_9PELO